MKPTFDNRARIVADPIRTVHSDACYLPTNRDRERTMASLSESCVAKPSNVHRLVIVEGIMGSGKSTTMRFIAKHLQEAGRPVVHIHESTDPHPVRATDELEHWFEPWRDATPKDLADRALARWTAFVEHTQSNAEIPVLDGQLFHGDMTHLLPTGNGRRRLLESHWTERYRDGDLDGRCFRVTLRRLLEARFAGYMRESIVSYQWLRDRGIGGRHRPASIGDDGRRNRRPDF